ncbi:hypothetical protein TNCV_5046541 [Trichonephila clavipes]|uniref:Uncharacterized protein n=1 Tax=Trichonephila clavipes TaxID=2585209 RepID=A0A8X7BL67_TRICX|nr:hypothetical protein TNCV_5046541 [Trichonephila clavipes]
MKEEVPLKDPKLLILLKYQYELTSNLIVRGWMSASYRTISKPRDNPRSTELHSLQFFQVCRRCYLKDLVDSLDLHTFNSRQTQSSVLKNTRRSRNTVRRLFLALLLGGRRKPSWRAFLLRMHTPASFLRFSEVLFSSADVRRSISGRAEDPEHYRGSSSLDALCREESAVLQQLLL